MEHEIFRCEGTNSIADTKTGDSGNANLGQLCFKNRKGQEFSTYYCETSDGLLHKLCIDDLMSWRRLRRRLRGYLPEIYTEADHYRVVNEGLATIVEVAK